MDFAGVTLPKMADLDEMIALLDHVPDPAGCKARLEEIQTAAAANDTALVEMQVARSALSDAASRINSLQTVLAAKEEALTRLKAALIARTAELAECERKYRESPAGIAAAEAEALAAAAAAVPADAEAAPLTVEEHTLSFGEAP